MAHFVTSMIINAESITCSHNGFGILHALWKDVLIAPSGAQS
jgi:hypothetical protein